MGKPNNLSSSPRTGSLVGGVNFHMLSSDLHTWPCMPPLNKQTNK